MVLDYSPTLAVTLARSETSSQRDDPARGARPSQKSGKAARNFRTSFRGVSVSGLSVVRKWKEIFRGLFVRRGRIVLVGSKHR
jgi:hypothetical protein